ncbi:hypothetical protein ABPG74_018677 [Tetrahymena malaccensis]
MEDQSDQNTCNLDSCDTEVQNYNFLDNEIEQMYSNFETLQNQMKITDRQFLKFENNLQQNEILNQECVEQVKLRNHFFEQNLEQDEPNEDGIFSFSKNEKIDQNQIQNDFFQKLIEKNSFQTNNIKEKQKNQFQQLQSSMRNKPNQNKIIPDQIGFRNQNNSKYQNNKQNQLDQNNKQNHIKKNVLLQNNNKDNSNISNNQLDDVQQQQYQAIFKDFLGINMEFVNNKNQSDLQLLNLNEKLDFSFRIQFKMEIQKAIDFIQEWIKENMTLIIDSNYSPETFEKIKIFTSYVIDLKNKFDQILIQSYENLLNNQKLEDLNQANECLDVFNQKQKYLEEDQEEIKEIIDLQTLIQQQQQQQQESIQRDDEEINSQNISSNNLSDQITDTSSQVSSVSDILPDKTENKNLNKEQKQQFNNFCWQLFNRFKKCLKLEIDMSKRNLPAYQARKEIQNQIEISQNPFILLMGSTGSGKTTQTPQVLYQHQLMDEKKWKKVIYCVQPRKINCLSISERVAEEMGCKLGEEVGYQVGYSVIEQKFDKFKTKIIFITESILMSMLVKQNKQKQKEIKKDFFKHCSYIILDEVHERSIKSDIIMGLAKNIFTQQNELKFFLSSATADREMYLKYFPQLPIIEIPGKIYPVDEEFIEEQESSVTKVIKHLNVVIDRIEQGAQLHNGHILVFMIDGLEIDECIKQASNLPKLDLQKYKLLPLHSRLEKDQQELVFKEHYNNQKQLMKKIIFSTNIAETAVTINNITIVIDCGMEKVAIFDPRKNITTIQSTFISKSSAKQRQGRAGRTCPGICYKLYSEEEYESFANEKIPEISRINIEQVLLQIIESGEQVETFPYFELPDQSILKCSKDNLIRLGAIDEVNNCLTEVGRIMQKSELEPFQIKCLIDSYKLDVSDEVTNILAVMPEIGGLFQREDKQKNTFYKNQNIQNDYNSDFLDYHKIFQTIKNLSKNDKNKRFIKENGIKFYPWMNILTNHNNLVKFRKMMQIKYPNVFQIQMDDSGDETEVRILKVMLNTYINQISTCSGLMQLGFLDMKSNVSFIIHPQSYYFKQTFYQGTVLLYGSIEDREKVTYAKHISEVKLEWLQDTTLFTKDFYNEVMQTIQEAQNNEYHYKTTASKFMINVFRKQYLTLVQEKINKYQQEYPKAKSFILLDNEQCLIKVASTKEGKNIFEERKIGSYIEELLNQERQIHRKKVMICKYKESENYAVIGEGYKIIDIILPNQFVKVKVTDLPTQNEQGEDITKHFVEDQFKLKSCKDYYDLFIHKSQYGSFAQIQFLTYQSAKEFIQNNENKMYGVSLVGVPESNIKNSVFEKFQLNIYIPTEQPTGVGYINFKDEQDRDATLNHLKFNGFTCKKQNKDNQRQQMKQYSIRLMNLQLYQNEEYIEKYIKQTNNGFQNICIERKKSNEINYDQQLINKYERVFEEYASQIVMAEDMPKISINIYTQQNSYLKAQISLQKREYYEQFLNNFSSSLTENGPLKIHFSNSLSISVDIDIYKFLKNKYLNYKDQFDQKKIKFNEKETDDDKAIIQVSISKIKHTKLLNQTIGKLKMMFKSQKLIFDIEYWQLDKILEKQKRSLKQMESQNQVIIKQNPKKPFLSIWFQTSNQKIRKQIKKKFESYIQSQFVGKETILLNKYNDIKSLILFIEQKQGLQIQKNQQKMTLEGQIGVLREVVQEANMKFRKHLQDDIQCQECFDSENLDRLDQCGCIFCKNCLEFFMTNNCSEIDILCCPKHKQIPITLEDSQNIIDSVEQDYMIENKIDDKIDDWKNSKNQLKFIRCPTNNCDSFFGRVYNQPYGQQQDQTFPPNIRCSECSQQFCLLQTADNFENSNVHEYHQGECEDQC